MKWIAGVGAGVWVWLAVVISVGLVQDAQVEATEQQYLITTVAGTGEAGFGGDGGPASEALLNEPSGVSVDGEGYLYIADNDNHRIRSVAPNGTITTFAGSGDAGFSGDGGLAINAELDSPYGVWAAPVVFIALLPERHAFHRPDAAGPRRGFELDLRRVRMVHGDEVLHALAGVRDHFGCRDPAAIVAILRNMIRSMQ